MSDQTLLLIKLPDRPRRPHRLIRGIDFSEAPRREAGPPCGWRIDAEDRDHLGGLASNHIPNTAGEKIRTFL